jgi:hypothetical protein
MDVHVESAAAALEKCWQLIREGKADLFRGQTRDWPKLIPSLYRTSAEERTSALDELEYFKDWARNIPQMAVYGGDDTALTAIAQHYGIPTTFLDLTTNPEIAVLFAKSSTGGEGADDAVIYCFLEAGLKSAAGARLIRINVDNLWRLEAQRGLFLNFLKESLTDTLRGQAIRIHFPLESLAAEERTRLYPLRKSALESVFDQWIYRRQIERFMTETFKETKYKLAVRRKTYPGAFRWRAVPELDFDWIEFESAWVVPPVESVSVVNNPKMVMLPTADFRDLDDARRELTAAIGEAIRENRATGQLITFCVNLSPTKARLSGSVSTIINRCWDGLRVLPYQVDEIIASISLIVLFLVARAEDVGGVDDWPERFFGELQGIEVAPIGGHIEAGMVSKEELGGAYSAQHLASMTTYMRKKAEVEPEFLGMYIVDHWMLFDFIAFKKLFVEQFIPTAVDGYWVQDLELYEGALGCMWSVNFNPALLGYVTPFGFRFYSPIAMEKDCESIVYVLPDMDRNDLEELFVSCLPKILAEKTPFQVRFHGYSGDERPIWEIECVVQQAKWIVEVGGISVLDVFPTVTSKSEDELERAYASIGAFEIWLISKELLQSVQGKAIEDIKPLLDEFWGDLMIANANLETRATSAADWPGPMA